MPETFALSESAVAVFRFRVKGYRMKVTDRSREAFRELATAGLDVGGRPGVGFLFHTRRLGAS